jgi:hypothetical protein
VEPVNLLIQNASMKKRTTTPAQEGIELEPDSWARFERVALQVASKAPIHRRKGKLVGADRPTSGLGRSKEEKPRLLGP